MSVLGVQIGPSPCGITFSSNPSVLIRAPTSVRNNIIINCRQWGHDNIFESSKSPSRSLGTSNILQAEDSRKNASSSAVYELFTENFKDSITVEPLVQRSIAIGVNVGGVLEGGGIQAGSTEVEVESSSFSELGGVSAGAEGTINSGFSVDTIDDRVKTKSFTNVSTE